MQRFGMIALGMLLLTVSSARAEQVVVKETETSWRGCVYRLSVVHDNTPPAAGKKSLYHTYLESEAASSECTVTPAVRFVESSLVEPIFAIVASDLGIVLAQAYISTGWLLEGMPYLLVASVNRDTLDTTELVGLFLPFVLPSEDVQALSNSYLNALQPNAGSSQGRGSAEGN
jgi:hypothetical protein